jgi:hypothetical protein
MSVLRTIPYLFLLSTLATAQAVLVGVDTQSSVAKAGDAALLVRLISPSSSDVPAGTVTSTSKTGESRLTPEQALDAYQRRASQQGSDLAAYSAATVIRAQLPRTAQQGEFELERHYAAPKTLEFKPVRYSGDGFVKSNIIARLLQSEVDHVQKGDSTATAISAANYKFSYKGAAQVAGRDTYIYQLKPHKNRVGLFKGRVFLDASTGSLVRTEGKIVKSPSFFVKNIEFLQEFADFGRFTFPIRLHSEATARIVGRTIVDIENRDFQPVASTVETARAGQ